MAPRIIPIYWMMAKTSPDGENVAGGEAGAPFHADAAQEDHQQGRSVQHEGRRGVDDLHAHVGADDVVRHGAGGVGDPLVGQTLPVEGPDDPDAPQPFPDQVVLLVAVIVGDLPELVDLLAHGKDRRQQQRHGAEDDERELNVLAHAEEDAAEEGQRNDDDAAAEHGDDPVQRAHVVGRARHKIGGADAAHLGERHAVDLTEQGGAEAPGVARDHVIDHPVAARNGGQTEQRDAEHPRAGFEDIAEGIRLRRAVNALVQDVGHQGGQKQVADRGDRHQERCQGDLAPVGLEIG